MFGSHDFRRCNDRSGVIVIDVFNVVNKFNN
jgi:hypothetical protein